MNVIMVATGTGLAPYMSMLRSAMPVDGSRRIAVLLGARGPCGLGYQLGLMLPLLICLRRRPVRGPPVTPRKPR